MDFEKNLKSAAWTEAEVVAVAIGSVAAVTMLDTKKIFKKEFAINPQWFEGPRPGAPFKIKHFGGIKAAGAVIASTYVSNPWIKLALMGVALQGTLEEVRMLSWDDKNGKYRFEKIGAGDAAQLDSELKHLAQQYRTHGPDYLNGEDDEMNGPDYVSGEDDGPLAERYNSSVAGNRAPYANRYESSVAKALTYDETEMDGPFSFGTSDGSNAF